MANLPLPVPASGPGHSHGPAAAGGKRQASTTSLNHLLNFSLPPREPVLQHRPRRARRVDQSTAVWNKERFVNAQHRFVLRPNGDYTVHFADPDIFFQWPDIQQVIIPPPSSVPSAQSHSSSALQCPICLSPPTAPRMTKCGHVYCYPCILHYLETAEARKWARCPICFDSIYEKALKPVLFLPSASRPLPAASASVTSLAAGSPEDGEELGPGSIRLRLMMKPPHTTLVLPRAASWTQGLVKPLETPFIFLPDVLTFSRFMLSTPAHLHASARRDLATLETELASLSSLQDELGASFVRRAMDRVREWEEQVDEQDLEDGGGKQRDRAERELDAFRARERRKERDRLRDREKEREANANSNSGAPLPEAPADFLASTSPVPGTPQPGVQLRGRPAPPPPPTYYYYQAANGAAVFLHPLDIRILRSAYGGYEHFPDEVVVGVEASEEGRVTPALRKTHKYLSHLPEGQDITFLEADLSTLCTLEQLAPFADLLHKRRERRRERFDKEERARRKAEREAEADLVARNASASAGAGGGWGRSVGRRARVEWEEGSASDEPDVEHGGSPRSGSVERASSSAPNTSAPGAASAPSTSPSGAWGNRTFASAALSTAHAPAAPRTQIRPLSHAPAREADADEVEREWEREREMDVAWLELESRALEERGGQGKGRARRKGQKLVLLGGSGRGRT
ncbi:hypothetical protein CALVIDRAFT_545528 [Calocera viscosa TUFC12733]|uniref:RING-type domain-containing protein n=1 Tax=Calocera viscosa (strain TUFC12733) TaxID=1330018 RepID=A0A167M6Z4_CALVF|nr:hypothetical protein CALVIDRAFT_545528 [Calocera viscosa TUFC12733]